jgi:hypothetical protein
MSASYGERLTHAAVGLAVVVVCLDRLADVLPHLVVPLAIVAGLVVVVRLVFFHTRRW